jgi:hypothetical protein
MSLYYFRIKSGQFSGIADHGTECTDHEAAWTELTQVCSDLLGGIARKMKQNANWEMELLDESRKTLFRITLVAESLD